MGFTAESKQWRNRSALTLTLEEHFLLRYTLVAFPHTLTPLFTNAQCVSVVQQNEGGMTIDLDSDTVNAEATSLPFERTGKIFGFYKMLQNDIQHSDNERNCHLFAKRKKNNTNPGRVGGLDCRCAIYLFWQHIDVNISWWKLNRLWINWLSCKNSHRKQHVFLLLYFTTAPKVDMFKWSSPTCHGVSDIVTVPHWHCTQEWNL